MNVMETKDIANVNVDALFERISALIEESRKEVATAVNIAEVYTKYEIGRYILEDEQEGKARAAYGKQILKQLSTKLQAKYGQGWGEDVLSNCRKFFIAYSAPQISDTACRKLPESEDQSNFRHSVSEIQNAPAGPHKFVLN